MNKSTPSNMVEAIKFCQHLPNSEALYRCLKPYWHGDVESARSVNEVLIRSLAIHIAAISSYGHLISLQGATKTRSFRLILSCLIYYLFPLLPIVQCIRRLINLTRHILRRNKTSYRYCLAVFLGIHVILPENPRQSVPLDKVAFASVQPRLGQFSILWAGRLMILIALVTQFVSTCLLGFRRDIIYKGLTRTWGIDALNQHIAISGVIVAIHNLLITILNTQWTAFPGYIHERRIEEISLRATYTTDSPEVSLEAPLDFGETRKESLLSRFVLRIREMNTSYSKSITYIYPATMQWDMEISLLLLGILVPLEQRTYGKSADGDGCPPVWRFLLKSALGVHCGHYEYGYANIPWLKYRLREFKGVEVVAILYYVPYIRVIIKVFSIPINNSERFKVFPNRVRRFVCALHVYLIGGRTLVGTCLDLLVILPLVLRVRLIVWDLQVMKRFEQSFRYSETDNFSKMALGLYLWKDPWHDNMYVM